MGESKRIAGRVQGEAKRSFKAGPHGNWGPPRRRERVHSGAGICCNVDVAVGVDGYALGLVERIRCGAISR